VQGPKCLAIFDSGVTDSRIYAMGMIALMGDVARGSISPTNANAICKAGGQLLRVKEMEVKYGRQYKEDGSKVLMLGEPT